MEKPVVYIDGQEGTTGLQIQERLQQREDIRLLSIAPDRRKDPAQRKACINQADLVFLCLPDGAAAEAVSLVERPETRVIDASTAHRTAPGWAYGFPELSPAHREAVEQGRWVANPGCHASGFIAAVYPLVSHGLLPRDFPLTAYSLTGYSGGGKKMIAQYEDEKRDARLDSHCIYATGLCHKHLPEMQKVCGLAVPPVFSPILGDYRQGMATTVLLPGYEAAQVWDCLAGHYAGQPLVQVGPLGGDGPAIYSGEWAGLDSLRLLVCGHKTQTAVTALFDNLGKGASGAAVENMNLMLGFDPYAGLKLNRDAD